MSNNIIDLSRILAENNLIAPGITISAKINIRGFGGVNLFTEKRGVITEIDKDGVKAIFEDRKKRYAKFEELTGIEGMDILRYAQAYKIKPKKKK